MLCHSYTNICSLLNIEQYIEYPKTKIDFGVIVNSESRNMKRKPPINKVNLKSYPLAVGTFFILAKCMYGYSHMDLKCLMNITSIICQINYPTKTKLFSFLRVLMQTNWSMNKHSSTTEIHESLPSQMFLPHNCETNKEKILFQNTCIYSIYLNVITPNTIMSNLTTTSRNFLMLLIFSQIQHPQN